MQRTRPPRSLECTPFNAVSWVTPPAHADRKEGGSPFSSQLAVSKRTRFFVHTLLYEKTAAVSIPLVYVVAREGGREGFMNGEVVIVST
jgi:hypothetical protein